MYTKIQKVFSVIIFIALSVISAVNIFLYGYDKVQKSYFPVKYGLVSFFQTIEIILLILGKIILLILLLAVSIFICYLIALLISTLITSLVFLVYKHSSRFKKYNQKLKEEIDFNNHNTNQDFFANKHRKQIILNDRRCELTAISDKINNIEIKINDLKTKLDHSILANYYKEHISDIKIENGSINLVTFAKVMKIYEIDTLLFAFNKSKNDEINWNFSFNK